MVTDRVKLKIYNRNLTLKKYRFPCPVCKIPTIPKDMEKHCFDIHGLNPKSCCVWCEGKENWKDGPKNRHADHLIQCFRAFTILNKHDTRDTAIVVEAAESFAAVSTKPRLLNIEPLSPVREFFDHENLSDSLPSLAFESFQVLDHGYRVSYFGIESLNVAASYVRIYIETRDNYDWIHAMVRAVTFESFATAMLEDGGRTRMLPFSCWCDGGEEEKALYRQHRHLVIVSPRNHFAKRVWPSVKASQKPRKGFKSKVMHFIESPMHLINTLGYVCKRESRCKFTIDSKAGQLQKKHFYMIESLPVDYLLPLSVQWDGGIMEMLYQEKFLNVSASLLINSRLMFEDAKWKQKIKDFYGIEKGLVLPLSEGYLPATDDNVSLHYCYLTDGRKLHFEFFVESKNLDRETWLRRQVEGGNCFYEVVGNEVWIPRHKDQEKLNFGMPIVKEKRRLEAEIENLKRKHEEEVTCLKRKYEEEVNLLRCEIKSRDCTIESITKRPSVQINRSVINASISCEKVKS